MAQTVTIDGEPYTRRSPFGAWGLSLITLGIYYFVWHYKVNDEARRFLRDETIKPGVALLAVLLGWVIIVPPFVSIYRTGERIERMQAQAGTSGRVLPILGLIASLFWGLQVPYYQSELNRIWDMAATSSGSGSPWDQQASPVPPPPPPDADTRPPAEA